MARISAGMDFGQAVVQPSRAPVVDVSPGVGAVAEGLNRIGVQRQNEGEQLQRQHDLEARQAAREAQIQRERADAGQAQAKLYAVRDGLSDELERIGQQVLDGTLPKTEAQKAWEDRSAKLLADNIEGVPESHRAAVTQDAQGLAGRLSSKVGDIVRKRDQHDTLGAIAQVQEYTQRLAISEPDKARQILTDTLDQLGPFAGLQPDQITKAKQGWVEGTAYTRAFTAVNAAKSDNKALGVVERGIAENTDLDPQRKAALLAQVDGYRANNEARALRQAQHAEIRAARAERESSQAFTILSGWAMAGKQADPNANAALIGKLSPTAAAAYREMAAEIPARTAVAMLPLAVQDQQLDQLRAQALKGTSQPLEAEIKRREQIRTEQRKAYSDDPLRAGNEYGVLPTPLRPLDTSSIDGIAAGMVERVQQAQAVSTRTGKPASPLLAEEATKLGAILSALPVSQRAERLSQVAAVMPADQAQALAGQLFAKDTDESKALGLALALGTSRTTASRTTAEIALKGAEALKLKTIKEERTPVDGWRGQINMQLAEVYPNPKQAQMYGEAARLILAGLVAEGASGNSSDAKQAVRLAIGGALVEHNGARIPVPAGLDAQDVRAKTRSMKPADLAPQLPDGQVYVYGKPMPPESFLASLPDAKLQYAGRGRYHVMTGTTLAANRNGDAIVIEVGK